MEAFSAGRAIGAGFRLIAREPLAVLAWAAVFLVAGVVPQVAIVSVIVPAMARMTEAARAAAQAHAEVAPGEMLRMQATMLQLQPISWLGSLVSYTLVLGAVYRAMLFPEDRRFLYLRFSMREVWLGLVLMVLAVMWFMGVFVAMVPTMIVTGVAAAMSHDGATMAPLAFVVVFAGIGILIWAFLRFSLATPMSFAERNFRVFESWSLTRGHAGRMFGVALALVVIVWVVELLLAAAAFAAVGGSVGFQAVAGWFQHPRGLDFASIAPWVVGGSVLAGALSTFFLILFGAAWAEIYRGVEAGAERPVGVAR
jgi:hypothetical protein